MVAAMYRSYLVQIMVPRIVRVEEIKFDIGVCQGGRESNSRGVCHGVTGRLLLVGDELGEEVGGGARPGKTTKETFSKKQH